MESGDKGAGLRGDKTGHSGVNIYRKGHTALCMHGDRTKRKHTVYCVCYTVATQSTSIAHSNKKQTNITLKCKSIKSPTTFYELYISPFKKGLFPAAAKTRFITVHGELFSSHNENSTESASNNRQLRKKT